MKKIQVPEFLLDLSKQMNSDPVRATSHPFWQVRCKRYLPTMEGYNDSHFALHDSGDGYEFYRSDKDDISVCLDYLFGNHEAWVSDWADYSGRSLDPNSDSVEKFFYDNFDPMGDIGELPDCINVVPMQEVEEIVSTHLTQAAAEQFIARKQHDYPPLYTYVESAYWSPQLRELQDWIKSLTE